MDDGTHEIGYREDGVMWVTASRIVPDAPQPSGTSALRGVWSNRCFARPPACGSAVAESPPDATSRRCAVPTWHVDLDVAAPPGDVLVSGEAK